MTRYKIIVTIPDLDSKVYTIYKRKYWITFGNFGWKKILETANLEEVRLYLELFVNEIRK